MRKKILSLIFVILMCCLLLLILMMTRKISVEADVKETTTSEIADNDDKQILTSTKIQTNYSSNEALAGSTVTLNQYALSKQLQLEEAKKSSNHLQKNINLVTYYATANVNIRKGKGISNEKVGMLHFAQSIEVIEYDEGGWSKVQYNNKTRYIKSCYLSRTPIKYKDYDVPFGNSFKAYMPYTAITSRSSSQWELQQKAYTGTYGIRQVSGRFCVAIGTYYGTKIGRKFDIIMNNGTVIPCITSDVKADAHTDSTNRQTMSDGSIVEFIVDINSLKSSARFHGDISYCEDGWMGEISKFRIYE